MTAKPPIQPIPLPRGAAREALVRALAALLLDDERDAQTRAALRRMRP